MVNYPWLLDKKWFDFFELLHFDDAPRLLRSIWTLLVSLRWCHGPRLSAPACCGLVVFLSVRNPLHFSWMFIGHVSIPRNFRSEIKIHMKKPKEKSAWMNSVWKRQARNYTIHTWIVSSNLIWDAVVIWSGQPDLGYSSRTVDWFYHTITTWYSRFT